MVLPHAPTVALVGESSASGREVINYGHYRVVLERVSVDADVESDFYSRARRHLTLRLGWIR